MKTLVIAEKPDMGRNIASVIEPKAVRHKTHLEGKDYIITWAIGHLVSLAEPDAYDAKYKRWNMDHLPIIPSSFRLVPNPRTKEQLEAIRRLANGCSRIINACDAGREGQLIFAYIMQYLRLNQPVQRLWISDLTKETIRTGFAQLKDDAEYDPLTKAARSRSEADWLIGMNGSRAFTTKHKALLSIGRVQTPVLALIYDRQKQIDAFVSSKYFVIYAYFSQGDVTYRGIWQGDAIIDSKQAEAIAAKVKQQKGRIAEYEAKNVKEYPYRLYDLTLLQREANAKYGFPAKKTLDIAQALYEKHKAISYPRTNSNYVTEQNISPMHQTLQKLKTVETYRELVGQANASLVHKNNKQVCQPDKVEDHHAILPTNTLPSKLTPDEQKIYDLIVRRFLSHFYHAAEYKVHQVLTVVQEEPFKTTIKQLLDPGWKVVYPKSNDAKSGDAKQDESVDEVEAAFALAPREEVYCDRVETKEKQTQPPKLYTEGTLLRAMESAGKQIEDEELRETMKDSGLGTPATRAATIERLKQVGYISAQGRSIAITPKGRATVEAIRLAGIDLLTSPAMTGRWEQRLNQIAKGEASPEPFMLQVEKFCAYIVDKVKAAAAVHIPEEKSAPSRKRTNYARTTKPKNQIAKGKS